MRFGDADGKPDVTALSTVKARWYQRPFSIAVVETSCLFTKKFRMPFFTYTVTALVGSEPFPPISRITW